MRNYALSMKPIKIEQTRRQELQAPLEEDEMELYQRSAGELGWITRQLRCDLAYENGVAQRAKTDACVGAARRSADFRLRSWNDVDLAQGVLVHLADSGHANGTPDHNEVMRYRSVGGYFLLVANPGTRPSEPTSSATTAA